MATSCWKVTLQERYVVVGAQEGVLTVGTAGIATFVVTTTGIDDGSYAASVANLPTGVTVQGDVRISKDSGTLTLAGSSSTVAGATPTLTLVIDGIVSGAFTLTILPKKTVSVGAQSGTLTAGTAGTVTYPVATAHIADGTYTATVAQLPTGVSVSGQVSIKGNTGTLTLAGNNSTTEGVTSTLTLTIDDATSEAFALTILPKKTVSVGAQSGTLTAGTAGTVTYPVATAHIADGTYTATVAQLPTGVSVSGQVSIKGNAGTLTLAGNSFTVAINTSVLTLTIDGTTSEAFKLTIAGVKTVGVGLQAGLAVTGVRSTVTFQVTTANIVTSQTGTIQWYSNAAGTIAAGPSSNIESAVVSTGGVNRTLTIVIGPPEKITAGVYWFRVVIDGVASNVGVLTISERTISVGVQSETVTAGRTRTVAYPVNTSNIAVSQTGTIYWYSDANGYYVTNAPSGVASATVSTGSSNRTLTINFDPIEKMVVGIYWFRVVIDGVESNVETLTIR